MLPEVFLTCTAYRDCRAPWTIPRWLQTRFRGKGFAPAVRKIAIFRRTEFDLTDLRVPTIIMPTSLLWRANKLGVGTRAIRMAPKYIFVTGGVVSSLGKGVAASSIGCLLESRSFKVTLQKCDPYLNVDPGTMSPFQLGVREPLVVPQIEVCLRSVLGHKHFAMLKGAHRARIDVQIRIAFLQRDFETATLEETADRGGSYAFSK